MGVKFRITSAAVHAPRPLRLDGSTNWLLMGTTHKLPCCSRPLRIAGAADPRNTKAVRANPDGLGVVAMGSAYTRSRIGSGSASTTSAGTPN
jgi:hypothetical protein